MAERMGKIALFNDRGNAAHLLAKSLEPHRGADAVIPAVPRGGVPVGHIVARDLDLPMEILSCRKITHPGDSKRFIRLHDPQEAAGMIYT